MTQRAQERRAEGLEPKVLETITLDDINVRLAQIFRLLQEQEPEGVVEPDIILAGLKVQQVDAPPGQPWFSLEIINDGPSTVLFAANTFLKPATVRVGEDRTFDMRRAAIRFFTIQGVGGQSSVRYVGVR